MRKRTKRLMDETELGKRAGQFPKDAGPAWVKYLKIKADGGLPVCYFTSPASYQVIDDLAVPPRPVD
jgi:hypothetical protein